MIKKQSLIVLVLLCFSAMGFGQIAAWDFFGESSPATSTADIYNVNLDASSLITRGATATASVATNSFRTQGFQNNGIFTANSDYFQVTLSATPGFTLLLSTIDARLSGTNTFAASPGVSSQFAYSLDGTNFTLIGTAQTTIGAPAGLTQIDLSGIPALQNISASTTVTLRYYASGQTTTGGWGFYSSASGVYGLSIGGNVISLTAPELQLADNTATNQNCGYIIDFGSQALSNNTDKTFSIKNIGSVNLDVTSFDITGDYSILSPATPFTVTSGSNTTVTVRFTPTVNGTRTGVLTINNNDSDEGSCTVNLTGVGYTPAPEINVEGNLGTFPDITNGDSTPSGTDNTLFAAQFIGASQSKSYRINNEGTANLILSGITIGGLNPGDFTVTVTPSNTITPSSYSLLEITFSPLASGMRTAIVSIVNNDSNENPFTFTIQGTGNCVSSSLSISPSSGPVGTTITVTGTNFGALTTATLSGINAFVTLLSSTTIEVIVPNNASTGNLMVVNDLGCTSSILFNVIDKTVGGCEGGSSLSDLIISEVTDATTGGLTYIEIYNGTGSNVQLNNYSLEVYSNGSSTPSGTVNLNSGNLSNNSTYVVAIGVAGSPDTSNTCSITGGNGQLANQMNGIGGINKKDNEHDAIRLLKSSGTIIVDQFGIYQDNSWMDATTITGDRGFNFRRLNTASPLPNPGGFSLTDWNIIDWAGSGQSSCFTNDYSDIGFYDFSTANSPMVSSGPIINSSCFSATISVSGNEGYSGGNGLTYQWYVNVPGDSNWSALTDDSTYNDVNTATLDILDTSLLEGYQYYCQVRENDSSCYKASDAVQLTLPTSTWTSGGWSNGIPTISTNVILDFNYDTGTNGSFSACNLIVNDNGMGGLYTLTIANNSFVEVQNNLTVNGKIIVNPKGSFVQINDLGTVTINTKTSITVEKETAKMMNWYEYTYWSSPVFGEKINLGLSDGSPDRRFLFNAKNYKDALKENGNSGNYSPGQDDIDDNGNDWQLTSGNDTMQRGVGYASTHNSSVFIGPGAPPYKFIYTFEGPFNNGIIPVYVYRNDSEMGDNNWNLIGNPYPSAISVDAFLTDNALVLGSVPLKPNVDGLKNGAIFLWSQASPPSANNPGNEKLNFKQSDYAIINWTMQAAGGDQIIPDRYIPSGQSFFITHDNNDTNVTLISSSPDPIYRGTITFNNSMRVAGNNDQFFRGSHSAVDNKLWLNLTSDNGIFNQTAIGYVEHATDDYDGMGFDTPRNLSTQTFSSIYTTIEGVDKKFAIQGKKPSSLSLKEVVKLGFYTSIDVATLYTISIAQMEGGFLTSNTIYLKDNMMNIVHDLSASDYTFTSEVGEFNDRFEIVFNPNIALSLEDQIISNSSLSIIEHNSGEVQFKLSSSLEMKSIEIIDILGRTLYKLPAEGNSKTYNLSNLSQGSYIAKVELANGVIITKKAVKRR